MDSEALLHREGCKHKKKLQEYTSERKKGEQLIKEYRNRRGACVEEDAKT